MNTTIAYFIVKEFKKIDEEWYSKDVVCNSFEDLEKYIDEHPKSYKLDIRVVRKIIN